MNNLLEEISLINTIHLKDVFSVDLYNNSIIEVHWNTKLKTIEKSHLQELTKTIGLLGNHKKMLVHITTFDFMHVSEEGRIYSATKNAGRYTLVSSIQIDSLAKRILFNFYMKFHKPMHPMKAFSDRNSAFEWLLSFKD